MKFPTSEMQGMMVDAMDTSKVMSHARKAADKRNLDDVLVIDVDAHHFETDSLREMAEYIEDPVQRQAIKSSTLLPGGSSTSFMPPNVGFQDMGGRVLRSRLRTTELSDPKKGHRDTEITLKWMDALSVDYCCLFPTPLLLAGVHPMREMEVGLARGYTAWLTDKITRNEPRIRTMVYLPTNTPDEAYRMVEDYGGRDDVLGFLVTSVRYRPVHDNKLMRVYSLIEDTGKPIAFHSAYNWQDQLLGQCNRFLSVHALGFPFFNMVHMTNWVLNGMPEKFPKLKSIWIESGLSWVVFLMHRLDNEYKMRSSECPTLKMLPSEYMRQMYFATQPMEVPDDLAELEATFDMLDAPNQLVYTSDYPHQDMDLPSVIWDLPFLDETAKRNILGDNARKLFNLDVSARFPKYKAA